MYVIVSNSHMTPVYMFAQGNEHDGRAPPQAPANTAWRKAAAAAGMVCHRLVRCCLALGLKLNQ